MQSIVGIWKLLNEVAYDRHGRTTAPYFGPTPMGLVSFMPNGRMMVVITDGRQQTEGPRAHMSYCGAYSFDGERLVTQVDGASDAFWGTSPQIRYGRVEGNTLILRPPVGALGAGEATNKFTWQRIE